MGVHEAHAVVWVQLAHHVLQRIWKTDLCGRRLKLNRATSRAQSRLLRFDGASLRKRFRLLNTLKTCIDGFWMMRRVNLLELSMDPVLIQLVIVLLLNLIKVFRLLLLAHLNNELELPVLGLLLSLTYCIVVTVDHKVFFTSLRF